MNITTIFVALALLLIGSTASPQEQPCYGTFILYSTCDGLNPNSNPNQGVGGMCYAHPSTNGIHMCIGQNFSGTPVQMPTHTCTLQPGSFCELNADVVAELSSDPPVCYQDCGTSETETGVNVQPVAAYGTSTSATGTPTCVPDFDEDIGASAPGVEQYVHWDCYPTCVDWVTTGTGTTVQIPGCEEADSSNCDPVTPPELPPGLPLKGDGDGPVVITPN